MVIMGETEGEIKMEMCSFCQIRDTGENITPGKGLKYL